MILTTMHVILSFALLYSQFCRSVKTDHTTHGGVLLAFYLLTVASVLSLFAPLVIADWRPSIETIVLLLSITVLQAVTSHFWRLGPPGSFKNDHSHGPEVG